jgi:hypothetical protein
MKRTEACTSSFWYSIFVIAAGCAVFVIARQNRLTFPYPWNDEARFYLPSWYFAEFGSLSPKILNAPNGIYWVPDGFYLWMGTLLTLFGRSITVARVLCEASVAASVTVFALVFVKITRSAMMAAIFTLLLVTPPVIFAANMVRMEAPLCLLFALAMWSHVNRFYLSAISLLLLSTLFHPALALALLSYGIALAATRKGVTRDDHRTWQEVSERALFVFVLFALLAEIGRVAMHFSLFQEHMHYQVVRKRSVKLWSLLIKPQAVLLSVEIAAILAWLGVRWRRILIDERCLLGPVAAAILGMQLYAVLGGLTAYDVYSLSIGPALSFCLVYRVVFVSSPSFGQLPL